MQTEQVATLQRIFGRSWQAFKDIFLGTENARTYDQLLLDALLIRLLRMCVNNQRALLHILRETDGELQQRLVTITEVNEVVMKEAYDYLEKYRRAG